MKEEIYKLINENKNMIYKIASKFSNYSNIEDLFQVGCLGVISAYKNFKNEFNTKFSTYAYTYILGEITNYLRNDKLIKLNTENAKLYKLYEKAKEYLTSANNRIPSITEIANFIGASEFDLHNAVENNYSVESFDTPIADDLLLYEVIGMDERIKIDEQIDLNQELEKLKEIDKKIIDYRYFKDYTQSETAALLGLSQVQVSRQETKILSKIKQKMAA